MLYRVTANESCILTIASLISAEAYEAEAVTETDVVAYVLPAAPFIALMNQSEAFRRLIFDGYSRRIVVLMSKSKSLSARGSMSGWPNGSWPSRTAALTSKRRSTRSPPILVRRAR